MSDHPTKCACGADDRTLHAMNCPNRPRRKICVQRDPRTGTPVQVDPAVQIVRDRTRMLMETYERPIDLYDEE